MVKPKFDKSTVAALFADYLGGETARKVAVKYGCSYGYPAMLKSKHGTVQNYLDGVILPPSNEHAKRRRYTPIPAEPKAATCKRPPVDNIDLARRYAAGEFDRAELVRRMRGEAA